MTYSLHTQWIVEIIKAWCQHCSMSTDKSRKQAIRTIIGMVCSTLGKGWPLFNPLLKNSAFPPRAQTKLSSQKPQKEETIPYLLT